MMIWPLLVLVLSVLYLAFAYGAWTLKPWAPMLGLVLAAASALLSVLGVVVGMQEVIGALVNIAVSAVIVYYLLRPDVKRAFRRR